MAITFRDVQAGDFRNRDTIRVSSNDPDLVASTNFSLLGDGEVKTGPPARKKSPHHVVGLKSHPELVAGKPRLCDDHLRGTDGELVSEMDRVFQHAFRG
jgi:hypothetical protein